MKHKDAAVLCALALSPVRSTQAAVYPLSPDPTPLLASSSGSAVARACARRQCGVAAQLAPATAALRLRAASGLRLRYPTD